MTSDDLAWVPEACTLPTVDRPLRLAEFDDLFATALRGQQRLSPTVLRWQLDPAAKARARDLTGRESSCCSFFTFTFTGDADAVRLDVEVPAAHVDVLDALAERAATTVARCGLRSSQVAAAAGVNLQTLRYYERRGLLAEPQRTLGGHRLYPPDTVALLTVIKAAQRLGFTLDEVAELLDAGRRRHPSADLRQRALNKITEIDARIADLTAIRAALTDVVDARCDSLTHCTCADCPIPFLTIGTAERPHGEPS